MMPEGVYYLNNSGLIIEGIKIWGSPVTPYHLGMAFNKKRGREIKKVWDGIPLWTDILITHSAPAGIMDGGFGCEDLLVRVKELKPSYHLFGHAHGYSEICKVDETTFINAAMVDSPDPLEIINYKLIAQPIVFEYIPEKRVEVQGGRK